MEKGACFILLRLFLGVIICSVFLVEASSKANALTRKIRSSQVYLLSTKAKSKKSLVCFPLKQSYRLGWLLRVRKKISFIEELSQKENRFSYARSGKRECSILRLTAACNDKRDNDEDGLLDYPDDTGCSSASDNDEEEHFNLLTPTPTLPNPATTPFPSSFQVFQKPFQGEYSLCSMFDHRYPQEFVHYDGTIITSTNEETTLGVDGHQGYDFCMKEGVPILAAYEGEVLFAGEEDPFYCPLLNKTVSGLGVIIRHLINGEVFHSVYFHFSTVDVAVGQKIAAGTQLGLSGNTGCSTGPHLHFDIQRSLSSNRWASVDPFGWNSETIDPWEEHSSGSRSITLWKNGSGPQPFRFVELPSNPSIGDNAWVTITRIQYAGFLDSSEVNNEFVELTLDSRYATQGYMNLSGYSLKNNSGSTYEFPSGFVIYKDQPVRVYSGKGLSTATILFWGRSSPVWGNNGDCARLIKPSGSRMYSFYYGEGCVSGSEGHTPGGRSREIHEIHSATMK